MATVSPATRRTLSTSIVRSILLLSSQLPIFASYPLLGKDKRNVIVFDDDDSEGNSESPKFWVYLAVSVVLVLLGGVFAGLTLGLMGQDEIYLQVIAQSGEDKEKKHARSVLKLLKRGKHWVLVTLLLGNVITNETLPIVLDRSLGGGWPAVLSSTVLIVIFGEIIPQSVCVRYGLAIGSLFSPFVLVLMYIMWPVAYPTALLLDRILGEDHGTTYKKAGLKTLVTLHKTLGEHPGERLNQDEVTIITAVLDLKDKPVGSVMTPMDDVFTMSTDTVLDEKTMDRILSKGYSRIPIHAPGEPTNFVGMLLVKILITYDPEDAMKVSDFPLATLPETAPETSCLDIVNFFQEGKSHMVMVSANPGENYGALGVITLEDVIEELIGEEIVDESDVYIDVHKAIRRMNPAPITRRTYGTQFPTDSTVANQTKQAEAVVGHTIEAQKVAGELDKLLPDLERPEGGRRASTGIIADGEPRRDSKTSIPPNIMRKFSDRGAIPDHLKESFKHLGPSNLASAPRQTQSKTIKIKTVSNSKTGETKTVSFDSGTKGDQPPAQFRLPSQASHTLIPSSVPEEGQSPGGTNGNHKQSNGSEALVVPEDEVKRTASPATSKFKKVRTGSLKTRENKVGGIRKIVVEAAEPEEDEEAVEEDSDSSGSGKNGGTSGKKDDDNADESTSLLGKK